MVFFVLKLLRLLVRLVLLPFRLVVRLLRAAVGFASDGDEPDELEDWPSHDDTDTAAGGETGAVAERDDQGTEPSAEVDPDTGVEPTGRVSGGESADDFGDGASTSVAPLGATDRERRLAQVFVVGLFGYAVCSALSPFVAGSRALPAVLGTATYGGAALGTARGSTAARWFGTGLLVVGALVVHLPFDVLSSVYDLGGTTLLDLVFFAAPATLAVLGPAETVLAIGLAVVGYLGRGGTGFDTSLPGLGGDERVGGVAGGSGGGGTSPTSALNSTSTATAGAGGAGETTTGSNAGDTIGRSRPPTPDADAGSEATERGGTAASTSGTAEATATGSAPSTTPSDPTASGASARTAPGGGHSLDSDATVLASDRDSVILAGDVVTCHEPNGEERWTFEPRDDPTAVAVGGGSVYVGTGTGRVHSLAADTGAEEWPLPFRAGTTVTDLGVGSYCYVAADDGRLRALDPPQGTTEWRSVVGGTAPRLAVTDDGLVASGEALVALDSDGTERWRHEVQGTGPAPVAATDGRIVFGTGRTVTALDGEAKVQWDATDEAPVTALAAADEAVVVARESSVTVHDAASGERTTGAASGAVAVAAPPTVVATGESVRFSSP